MTAQPSSQSTSGTSNRPMAAPVQPQEVRYLGDDRYPGPPVYPCPAEIQGIPTQDELDAHVSMLTWGELKEAARSGKLQLLMRNKDMQARYDAWSRGMKEAYGTTENYLIQARLPWPASPVIPPLQPTLAPSAIPPHVDPTPIGRGAHASGTSTPSSAGFVSLAEQGELVSSDDAERPSYLTYDPSTGLDLELYAVLPNDWPYSLPHGVRHFCVWSKIPIAHPSLVSNDPSLWSQIEQEGLSGFTGIIPLLVNPYLTATQPPPKNTATSAHIAAAPESPSTASYRTLRVSRTTPPPSPPPLTSFTHPDAGSAAPHAWVSVDALFGGTEMRRWAGVTYEAKGGGEVGKMVRGLWDERGWECIWFVNPPRLQSVRGFSHFHVLARRKTPGEIDASEKAHDVLSGQSSP